VIHVEEIKIEEKVLRIGVSSKEAIRKRTIDIASGAIQPTDHDPKVWVTSTQALAQLLSAENIGLLKIIQTTHPASVSELARTTGRQQGNLSRTLANMSQYGLVSLSKEANNQIRPVANATRIEVEIDLSVAG
jgi:predicted transcriptional regulator